MKLRGLTAVSLLALMVAVAGCGSSSSSSSPNGGQGPPQSTSTPSTTGGSTTSTPGGSTTSTPRRRGKKLQAGQHCSQSKESFYASRGFTCVNGILQQVGGANSTAKPTPTGPIAPDRSAIPKPAPPPTTPYRPGQSCKSTNEVAYQSAGLTCVGGRLQLIKK